MQSMPASTRNIILIFAAILALGVVPVAASTTAMGAAQSFPEYWSAHPGQFISFTGGVDYFDMQVEQSLSSWAGPTRGSTPNVTMYVSFAAGEAGSYALKLNYENGAYHLDECNVDSTSGSWTCSFSKSETVGQAQIQTDVSASGVIGQYPSLPNRFFLKQFSLTKTTVNGFGTTTLTQNLTDPTYATVDLQPCSLPDIQPYCPR